MPVINVHGSLAIKISILLFNVSQHKSILLSTDERSHVVTTVIPCVKASILLINVWQQSAISTSITSNLLLIVRQHSAISISIISNLLETDERSQVTVVLESASILL